MPDEKQNEGSRKPAMARGAVDERPRTDECSAASVEAGHLFEELYEELHRVARGCMSTQARGHTLQTTALVSEAFLRLARSDPERWSSEDHFMAVAARAMRSVLVDHARKRHALKRHMPGLRLSLDGLADSLALRSASILDLDAALSELEDMGETSARAVRVVELRFFCGLNLPEIAKALSSSLRAVERDWNFARAWLGARLR